MLAERAEQKGRVLTLPVKGTMWCSHSEKISMSRTMTISSCSSSKIAFAMTSVLPSVFEVSAVYTHTLTAETDFVAASHPEECFGVAFGRAQ